jgi:hypothetical protein
VRTAIIIGCGVLLWAGCVAAAKFASGDGSLTAATIVFVVIWFIVASVNLWIGVSRAGYAFTEELPIFLVVFFLPVILAVLVKWKWH